MFLRRRVQSSPKLKALILWVIQSRREHRPRIWVRLLVNPFLHKRGRGAIIRWRSRLDVFPYNPFSLGKDSLIEDFAIINNGVGAIIIGERTIIGLSNVIIGPVSIGSDVMLAQHVVISGLNHAYQDIAIPPSKQKVTTSPIYISDAVWIGANSVITAGVSIGTHGIVGAGSVVTKDVPAYSVVAGNPARIIRQFDVETQKWERV